MAENMSESRDAGHTKNDYANYSALFESAKGEAKTEAEGVALWVRPEELYAHPNVLDRQAYERSLGHAEMELHYYKTEVQTNELALDQLMHDYDAETDRPTMNVWDKPDFNLQAELNRRQGPFMEFGGPTYDGLRVLEGLTMPQKVVVSNVEQGYPVTVDGQESIVGQVDLVADITRMPLDDESLGAVLASSISADLHPGALAESMRVLEPGGLVFWQNGKIADLQLAEQQGFRVVRGMSTLIPRSRPQVSFVFQKPSDSIIR